MGNDFSFWVCWELKEEALLYNEVRQIFENCCTSKVYMWLLVHWLSDTLLSGKDCIDWPRWAGWLAQMCLLSKWRIRAKLAGGRSPTVFPRRRFLSPILFLSLSTLQLLHILMHRLAVFHCSTTCTCTPSLQWLTASLINCLSLILNDILHFFR